MKKILLSSVALLGLATGAMAADLPSRRAPAPIVAAVPVFTWTGFYVGVNAGYGWNTNDSITVGGVRFDLDDDGGFVGGAQAGYNYQIGSFVVGLEGDIQYADFGGDDRFDFNNDGILDGDFNNSDWFGTVRARAGVAFDRALIYATGGFAFADDATGWTVGGGLEYAFTNNLSAKIEGLYVNLDQDNNSIFNIDNDAEFGVVRAGLNFRFGTY
ncbi:porin family protein [Microvirga terrae]|uniref:Porin family protein n=1 Tax=Microvirga terrae TaxID=2740529 RepID=A0ABY5RPM2_9HYPH|nr:outer membrane protein [Microvirga terrae]UVF17752.1 porin family protein [Microvirga terrae]